MGDLIINLESGIEALRRHRTRKGYNFMGNKQRTHFMEKRVFMGKSPLGRQLTSLAAGQLTSLAERN